MKKIISFFGLFLTVFSFSVFATGDIKVNVDAASTIKTTNDVIPEAVYYVTAYYENGKMKTITVSSAAEAKIKKDQFLRKDGVEKVHIESKYPTIYRDCNDDWFYN
jgi:hypothetical protein